MSTQESSFDFIRWSHSKLFHSLSNGSVRATVLWAPHWILSVALLLFISISYKTFLSKELGWKQTEFEMWPDFHNTLSSCSFIRDPKCGLLPRIWRISYTYFWWHINSNQINCSSSITRGVAAPFPEPEAHVLSVREFWVELEFRSASFWRMGKPEHPGENLSEQSKNQQKT